MISALLQSVAWGEVSLSGSDMEGIAFLFLVVIVVVHVGFAIAVHGDAREVRDDAERRLFASPLLWSLATLLGGVMTAAIYWVIHRSPLGHDAPLNRVRG